MSRAFKFFDIATLFFLCSLIFFLPISKAAIQITVSLTILAFLGASFSKKFKNFPKTELNIPLLIFFGFFCLSVIFSVDFKTSLITLLKKNLEWFLLIFAVVSTLNTEKRIKIFLCVLFFSALCVSIDGIYQQIFGFDLFRGYAYERRISASFSHYNDFAGYLGVLLPITISIHIFGKNKYRIFFSFFSILFGYCLVMTLSRGGYFAVFFGLDFLILFCLLRIRSINHRRLVLGLTFFINTLVLVIIVGVYKLPFDLIIERLRVQHGAGRTDLWQFAFKLFRNRPFLGYGPGSFMTAYSNIKNNLSPTYAHNCYLQMLAEIGIFGFISFLSIIVIFFKKAISQVIKNNDFLLLGVLSGILAYLVHAGFDTHFYSMQLSDFFWIMLGLAIAIVKHCPTEI